LPDRNRAGIGDRIVTRTSDRTLTTHGWSRLREERGPLDRRTPTSQRRPHRSPQSSERQGSGSRQIASQLRSSSATRSREGARLYVANNGLIGVDAERSTSPRDYDQRRPHPGDPTRDRRRFRHRSPARRIRAGTKSRRDVGLSRCRK
jgi:hypothetical protein